MHHSCCPSKTRCAGGGHISAPLSCFLSLYLSPRAPSFSTKALPLLLLVRAWYLLCNGRGFLPASLIATIFPTIASNGMCAIMMMVFNRIEPRAKRRKTTYFLYAKGIGVEPRRVIDTIATRSPGCCELPLRVLAAFTYIPPVTLISHGCFSH